MKVLFFVLALTLGGCSEGDLETDQATPGGGSPEGKPAVAKLFSSQDAQEMLASLGPATNYYQVREGYGLGGEIVFLASQGGPLDNLGTNYFPFHNQFFNMISVHQAQTLPAGEGDGLDGSLLDGSKLITNKTAQKAALKSAAMLHKVVEYFKDQGKTVYIQSHSFGSFILPYTLAHYRNNFDKIIVTAGRVTMPSEVYNAFGRDYSGFFSEDNGVISFRPITLDEVKEYFRDTFSDLSEEEIDIRVMIARAGGRLQAAVGGIDYTKALDHLDLENLLYIYGTRDTAVGVLSEDEVSFLKSHNAQVIALEGVGHEVKDLKAFDDPPTVKTLTGTSFNSKLLNFLTSPLPSTYDLLNMPASDDMAYYLGGPDEDGDTDTKFDIGIVFENHSKKQVSYKLNALFGDGPFSLFKTNVFKGHEEKFRILFGRISQSEDTNEYPIGNTTSTSSEIAKYKKNLWGSCR